MLCVVAWDRQSKIEDLRWSRWRPIICALLKEEGFMTSKDLTAACISKILQEINMFPSIRDGIALT
ncbi:hypothetical protein Sjap_023096 [Stephania japonica]|uniref:Uncharacterized protein n=1 Tax=Stephania japonica TaxID=461633 RepID=A0AAP0EYX6_9MAGN